jgi:hypothetical protein
LQPDEAGGGGLAAADFLGADVDHAGGAGVVEVGQAG